MNLFLQQLHIARAEAIGRKLEEESMVLCGYQMGELDPGRMSKATQLSLSALSSEFLKPNSQTNTYF